MENSGFQNLENERPEWYLSPGGENYTGPYRTEEIQEKLLKKEVAWIDYVYRDKDGEWIRLVDHPTFQSLKLDPPKPKPKTMVPPPPRKQEPELKWFVYQNETQTGPFPTSEVLRLLQSAQIQKDAFFWREGFQDWKNLADLPELQISETPKSNTPQDVREASSSRRVQENVTSSLSSHQTLNLVEQSAAVQTAVTNANQEKRRAPRKPMLAKVYFALDQTVDLGMCRDISVGGMQILTEGFVGNVGGVVKLNLTPPQDSGLKPFTAEAVLVRYLEGGKGFSCRFQKISDAAVEQIRQYVGESHS